MPTIQTTALVLAAIGEQEYGPLDLLNILKQRGIAESDAREAISFLINDHQVEMTPNRRLRACALTV
jgi:hypothetical protein